MRDRGFALLIVLWSVVLLALLATQVAATGRTEVQLAANLRAAAVAEAAADGAIQAAAFHLLDPADPWTAGTERLVRVGSAAVTVRVDNESGKLNPNLAEPALMAALLRQLGTDQPVADRLAAAIADWRTPAEAGRPVSAKAAPYQAAGLDYGPPGTPFADLDELGAVLGMTPALLARLRPLLSTYTDTALDPAAAAPPLWRALQDTLGRLAAAPPAPLRTVSVTARAEGAGGRFTRRAVLRLGRTAKEAPMLVLAWEAGEE